MLFFIYGWLRPPESWVLQSASGAMRIALLYSVVVDWLRAGMFPGATCI